ncbi:MAG: FMN-binding negative transcriptional regulator [Alicyclobacillaceae bacterium]|jgi:transcriptional regulator|nr:FMN-binding negative transcriptional regulator [Alicyclobacillaceae bacterium]
MYVPKPFEMSQPDEISAFIRANNFGILVSQGESGPLATHLPFYYDAPESALLGHMAKANPQWKNLASQEVLAIFQGPHAYISPSWYQIPKSVPTWDYVAVHVYGRCSLVLDDDGMRNMLDKLVRFHEPDSALPDQSGETFYRNMMKEIVGFQIRITNIQGASKLSQNKPIAVQERVAMHLRQVGDAGSVGVAENIERFVQTKRPQA